MRVFSPRAFVSGLVGIALCCVSSSVIAAAPPASRPAMAPESRAVAKSTPRPAKAPESRAVAKPTKTPEIPVLPFAKPKPQSWLKTSWALPAYATVRTSVAVQRVWSQRLASIGVRARFFPTKGRLHLCLNQKDLKKSGARDSVWGSARKKWGSAREVIGVLRAPGRMGFYQVLDDNKAFLAFYEKMRGSLRAHIRASAQAYYRPRMNTGVSRYFTTKKLEVLQAWVAKHAAALLKASDGKVQLLVQAQADGGAGVHWGKGSVHRTWRTVATSTKSVASQSDLSQIRVLRGQRGMPTVGFALKKQASEFLSKWTATHIGQRLAIVFDGVVYTMPVIMGRITGGRVQISLGTGSPQSVARQAQTLVTLLRSGTLPVPVTLTKQSTDPADTTDCARGLDQNTWAKALARLPKFSGLTRLPTTGVSTATSRPVSRPVAVRAAVPTSAVAARPAPSRPAPFVSNSPVRGNPQAPVTLTMFTSFACRYCAQVALKMKTLLKAYKGRVKLVFKHTPYSALDHFVAKATMAAHAQGKFWEMHDMVYFNQSRLSREMVYLYAKGLKLDMIRFGKDMNARVAYEQIYQDLLLARRAGLRGLPTFLVNGQILRTRPTFSHLKKMIDPILIKRGVKASELPEEPSANIPLAGSPAKGPIKPLVTIVEFSDFQCPYCARIGATINQVAKVYGKYVRVVFKHFPLNFHKDANLAAQASMAAHEQGKFWPYHDLLMANQRALKRPNLDAYAKRLGLDVAKFKVALDSGKYRALVRRDMRLGMQLQVRGTPTIFINGLQAKTYSFAQFKKKLDSILLKKGVPRRKLPTIPPVRFDLTGSPAKGSDKAMITLVEFSDFQCPYCARFSKTLDRVSKTYGKYVKVVFKHFPLGFHKDAALAAEASMAAKEQGKFWPYHDLLMKNQRALKRPNLDAYAKQLGLDMAKFKAALDSRKYRAFVQRDMQAGVRAGVRGTPTMYLNGRKARLYRFSQFKQAFDRILLQNGVPRDKLPQEPPHKINTKGSPAMGPASAPLTIVEFSDFQCPYCARFSPVLKKVQQLYGKRLRVVFKHFPLSFHKDAHLAAQASMAAHAQGKFWPYHDLLMKNQRALKRLNLDAYAKQLGLDMKKFRDALDNSIYRGAVNQDMRDGQAISVPGTPSLYLNGRKFSAYSVGAMVQQLNARFRKLGVPAKDLPKP